MKRRIIVGAILFGACLVYVRMQIVGMEQKTDAPESEFVQGDVVKNFNTLPPEMQYDIRSRLKIPKIEKLLSQILRHPRVLNLLKAKHLFSSIFSPDGTKVATVEENNTINIWDVDSGNQISTLNVGSTYCATLSPDWKTFAIATYHQNANTITIWDIASKKSLETFHIPDQILTLAFSPDGNSIAIGTPNSVLVLDKKSKIITHNLQIPMQENSYIEFSPNGKNIGIIPNSTNAILWNIESNNQLPLITNLPGARIAFSNNKIATSTLTGQLTIWDSNSGDKLQTFDATMGPSKLGFNDNENRIVISSSIEILVLNPETQERLRSSYGGSVLIESAAFSPDCKKMIMQAGIKTAILDIQFFTEPEVKAIIQEMKQNIDQLRLLVEIEKTFKNMLYTDVSEAITVSRMRPMNPIAATPEQWATFLTLPQGVQNALKPRIKKPLSVEEQFDYLTPGMGV